VGAVELSVVIVNYETGGLLGECLDSLRRFADGVALEVLVVDNASRDASLGALARFPEVQLLANRENVGFARAVNQALEAAQGRYVLLLNPDCRLVAPVFAELIAFADARPDAAVVGPRLANPDGTLQTSAYRFPTLVQALGTVLGLKRLVPVAFLRARASGWLGRYFGQLDPHTTPGAVDLVTGACMLIRREALRRLGGFDPRFFLYFEEKDFCYRARQAGWAVYFDPAAVVVHHIGGSSRGDPATTVVERCRSMRQFYDKHYRRPTRLALQGVLLLGGVLRLVEAGLRGNRAAARAWRAVLALACGPVRPRPPG
jgi:GT2 family glycosyltransferase